MRRHVALALSLLLVAGGATAAGVATAGAATPNVVPKVAIKIVSGSACVPASSFCFKPALKSVKSGTKVIWKNTTIAPHTITRCDAAHCSGTSGGTGTDTGFGSTGSIGNGAKYTFTFHGKGTYVYYCAIHGFALMHGTITVT